MSTSTPEPAGRPSPERDAALQRALADAVAAYGARVREHGEIAPFPAESAVSSTDVADHRRRHAEGVGDLLVRDRRHVRRLDMEPVSTDTVREARLLPDRRQDHYLVNAEREARARGLFDLPIVDCDSHCYETACLPEIVAYIESPNVRRSFSFNSPMVVEPGLISGNLGDRTAGGRIRAGGAAAGEAGVYPLDRDGSLHPVAATTLRSMDALAIDYSIVFPTPMLNLGQNPDLAVRDELTWAFNRWLVEDVIPSDERLLAMPLLPIHDPEQSLRNIEAFTGRPGVVGFMVTCLHNEPLHRNPYMRVFDALNERGLPVAFHSAPNWREKPFAVLDSFLGVHALGFPFYAMVHLTNIVLVGHARALPAHPLDLHGGRAGVGPVHDRPARQRVQAALLRGAAAHAAAQRVHPRVLLHDPAVREPRAGHGHARDVRHDERGPDAPVRLGLPAPGLRHPGGDLGPARFQRRGEARDPRRQRAGAVRPPGADHDAAMTSRASTPATAPLHWWTARDLAAAIRRRELSAREVVAWHLDRIEDVNPRINAIVSLAPEAALAAADAADRRAGAGEPLGPLHGLPIAIKDLEDTAGIRTTYGSARVRRARARRPTACSSSACARRGRSWSARPTRRSSASARTRSTRCSAPPATRGRWTARPAAAAAAPARRWPRASLPIADGSDHGGSIRNPASFNNVVGLRPTPGLVPDSGSGDVWDVASVAGPMARTVGDLALMLTAISAPDRALPALARRSGRVRRASCAASCPGCASRGARTSAGCRSSPQVLGVLDGARDRLSALGAEVRGRALDLSAADEAFETLRALAFARSFGPSLDALRAGRQGHPHLERRARPGARRTGDRARRSRPGPRCSPRSPTSCERFDVLAAPAAQVVPFPVEQEYPSRSPA